MNENAALEINNLSKKIVSPEGAVKNGFEKITADFPYGIIVSIFSKNNYNLNYRIYINIKHKILCS